MTDLLDAWDELHAATPPGWYVGRPLGCLGQRGEHSTARDSYGRLVTKNVK